jgi:hypothetical protein
MFIVEDGTGLSNANSYCTTVFGDTYFSERDNSVWDSFFDDKKQAALIRATDYIEMRFGSQFKGVKYKTTQALSFPSIIVSTPTGDYIYDLIDPTLVIGITIPIAIQRATCEYAVRSLTGSLTTDDSNLTGMNKRVKVGSIETETSYPTSQQPIKQFHSYPTADLLIKPYLKSNSSQVIR